MSRVHMGHSGKVSPGIYRGTVNGIESGHGTARIEVRVGPGGCRIVDYEVVSDRHGLQHIEHGILSPVALHLAFGEAPGVTVFHVRGVGVYEAEGDPLMQIHISYDGDVLTWAGTGTQGATASQNAPGPHAAGWTVDNETAALYPITGSLAGSNKRHVTIAATP